MGGLPTLFRPQTPKAVGGQWRPPQWNKPAMVSVTVPAGYSLPGNVVATGGSGGSAAAMFSLPAISASAQTTYVFDAVLSLEHDQTLTKTNHPVQSGASITSHAYLEPAQLVLYVLMSDVAQSYAAVSQTTAPFVQSWTGNPSKSISAYQQMLTLQAARIPLTVVTRLRTYKNMLILRVAPQENDKTITGARFRLEFSQIFLANTQATPVSTRINETGSTGLGAVNVQPPTATTTKQFSLPASQPKTNIPGAGFWSSVTQQFKDFGDLVTRSFPGG